MLKDARLMLKEGVSLTTCLTRSGSNEARLSCRGRAGITMPATTGQDTYGETVVRPGAGSADALVTGLKTVHAHILAPYSAASGMKATN